MHYCTFHKNETKVLIDQNDQSRINNLNPHHSLRGVIAAETQLSLLKIKHGAG